MSKFLNRTSTREAISDATNNGCVFVMLGHGKYCLIDKDDIHLLGKYRWHYNLRGYAARWARKDGRQKLVYLHRLVINAPDGKFCDHINHDTLDNRKCNLRLCNKSQNACNSRKRKNTISKFRGVCWDKSKRKYTAQIRTLGRQINLGRFFSEEEAAAAYNKAAIEHHGVFAKLNSIK